MNLIEHPLYLEDLINTVNSFHYWDVFQNKVIMIVGATGMVGSFIVDVLMLLNERQDLQCRILAIGRDTAKARKRFSTYWESPLFQFVAQDINEGIFIEESVNFVLHMASNTHPVAYVTDPIGTIITNILGTKKLLEWSASNKISRFLYASSVEIYGENRGDVDYFNSVRNPMIKTVYISRIPPPPNNNIMN
jgi:UDP-glucuronate decarboxylase